MNVSRMLQSWRDAIARAKAPTVLLELQDERLRMQRFGGGVELDIPLPHGLCVAGFPHEIEALGDLIGDLLVEQGWVNAVVVAALPSPAAVLRLLEAPGCKDANALRLLVQEQEDRLRLPFVLAAADLDLQRLDSQQGRWLMVAARQKLVESWLRVFDLAGAQLKRLEPVQLCWLALIEALAPQGLTLVVEAEAGTGQLFVAIDQQPIYQAVLAGREDAWPEQVQQVVRGLRAHGLLERSEGSLLAPDIAPALSIGLDQALGAPLAKIGASGPYASVALSGLAQLV